MSEVSSMVLSLPRRNRRALYLLAHRANHATRWDGYRRWDGGAPVIVSDIDLLKVKESRKKAEREAAATGLLQGGATMKAIRKRMESGLFSIRHMFARGGGHRG